MSRVTSKSTSRPCTAFFPRIHFSDHTFRTTNPNPAESSAPPHDAIPAEAAKQANPVESSPESLARAKKWSTVDCAMSHGKDGADKPTWPPT
jgi:hypothetical protein